MFRGSYVRPASLRDNQAHGALGQLQSTQVCAQSVERVSVTVVVRVAFAVHTKTTTTREVWLTLPTCGVYSNN